MQFNESLDERETDSQSALRPGQRAFGLHEEIKDLRQQSRINADAGIAHADDDLRIFPLAGQPNAASLVRILGGVQQEIADNLGQAHDVAFEKEGLLRQRHMEFVALGVNGRLGGFHRAREHGGQVHPLFAQLDTIPHNARNIK